MRTTLNLDDELMRTVKRIAADTGRTITSLVEEALRELVRRERRAGGKERLHWKIVKGGAQAGVDLDDRDALIDRMEGLR
jgi:hypothetical protein